MFRSVLKGFQDVALLLARIALGVVLIAHGWWRWQIVGYEQQVEFVTELGMPMPGGIAALTIGFEMVGGVLLLFGLGTPLVGLGLVVLHVGIILSHKLENGLFLVDGGIEYNVVLAAIGMVFLAFGPGRLGVDHLFFAPRENRNRSGDIPSETLPATQPRESEETIFHRKGTGNS